VTTLAWHVLIKPRHGKFWPSSNWDGAFLPCVSVSLLLITPSIDGIQKVHNIGIAFTGFFSIDHEEFEIKTELNQKS
jgi:hypothetical protein